MSKPLTRKEQYYANIAGEGIEIPAKPITREEAYLEKIAQGGGVVANPEGTPAGTLETVKIGDVVYEVPQGGGSGTTNYNLLNNKPSINGHELEGNKSASDLELFDGDYAHLTNKPSIPAAQVNSDWNATSGVAEIKNKPSIPSTLSQLSDDASHRTVSDTEKNAWNAKSNFSGDYSDLTNKPTIPDAQIQSDWNQTDNTKADYIKNKPDFTQVQADWSQSDNTKVDYIKNKPTLGTASAKNVAASGDAGLTEVVMGDDSRLTDSRPASDVSSWAKASAKPTYSASEVGAIASTALGAAGGVAELGNDGKVPSAQLPNLFDGDYDSLSHRPSIGGVTLTGDKSTSALGLQAEMQLASMPTASADYAGKLVQYIGATDATYNHGYFYECVLNQGVYIWQQTNVQASSGGGGGTGDYTDLTNKPQINGVTLSGNKSTSDLGINAAGVGLGNVPNVTTDDQTPTFTTAQSRNNLVSGEKISVMLGKISKFFNDLKTVAFTGNYNDLSNKPETTVIDWEDWIELTPQEQETGNYNITNCPWADGDVSVDLMTKLWENPSPTASFSEQDIQIADAPNYDIYVIMYAQLNSASSYKLSTLGIDMMRLETLGTGSTGVRGSSRNVTISGATFSFGNCKTAVGTTAETTDNTRCIPITIYGIKTTASVKINAIAMDVNTAADHCMMSDGETSVEDLINGVVIASVTADGVKTYGQLVDELYPYIGDANILMDATNIFYPRNTTAYFSVNLSSAGHIVVYAIRMLSSGSTWKAYSVDTGSMTDYTNTVADQGRVIKLIKRC